MKFLLRPVFVFLMIVSFLMLALFAAAQTSEKTANVVRQPLPDLPATFSFAGESVPLQDLMVREQWDRELLYNLYQPHFLYYILKRSGRYFPIIEARLKANGIPEDFKYLCVAESNLQNAISKVGATGFWQFMAGTAPGYGLEVNASVDERYHVEKSTDAACRYLKNAFKTFGSWTAAAASYNCGQGGYNNQATFQRTKNYYDLQLPDETSKYIFRILTFKYLMENASMFGFIISPAEKYPALPVKIVNVDYAVANLTEFAQSHGITYKTLRDYNPWIRGRSLPARKGKTYTVLLPDQQNRLP
ncbi:MAG: lytic transglycosylase domain-containing protein [Chitinophagaceae bacterium]|nr:lytic transglycosylase domain-containing protein [Chitinophagaceae bacterium]